MLATIKRQLNNFPIPPAGTAQIGTQSAAAVLLILHGDPKDPLIILTERAVHLNNHAGEVAFPGGMREDGDRDLLSTALRETEEEIGLPSSKIDLLAMLPNNSLRTSNLRVTPFVGWVEAPYVLNPDPSEIASIFDLPLSYLMDINHYRYFNFKEGEMKLPCIEYQQYKIGGFTLKVMVDMLNVTLDAQIKLRYPSQKQRQQSGDK